MCRHKLKACFAKLGLLIAPGIVGVILANAGNRLGHFLYNEAALGILPCQTISECRALSENP